MKNLLLYVVLLLFIVACKQKIPECSDCKPLQLETYNGACFGTDPEEILICNGYCKDCLGQYDFIDLAYKYLDKITDKQKKDLVFIWFLPDNLEPLEWGELFDDDLRKIAIVRIAFSHNEGYKYPRIFLITYFINSVEYNINLDSYNSNIDKKADTINTDSVNLKKALKELNPSYKK